MSSTSPRQLRVAPGGVALPSDMEPPPSALDARPAAPLLVSNGLENDPAALRSRLAADGYLFFKGILGRDAVRSVRQEIFRGLYGLGWVASPDRAEPASGFSTHVPRSDFWPGAELMLRNPALHELAFGEQLGRVLAAVYQCEYFTHPRRMPRVKFPMSGSEWSETFAHQDFPYVQGSVDTLTAWMPLGDCSVSEGSLEVLAGSHLKGLQPVIYGPKYPCSATTVDNDDPGWRGGDYEAGDVLIFTCLTVHRARPNLSGSVRISVDCRFQPVSEPVCPPALDPAFTPDVPSWSELLPPRFEHLYRIPESVRTVPFIPPTSTLIHPVPGSAFPWMAQR